MSEAPIIIAGDEQSRINPDLADFGLPPAIGVRSVQIFRASRDVSERCDQKGWTYHHHVDMACWKGKLYVGWNSCEKDEDVWPSRELFSTSDDGVNWTDPQELFPQGVSTCLRMYFFLAPNRKMLAIAGLRTGLADTDEDTKGGLVVREIFADHRLGDVFTLQPENPPARAPAHFTQSDDESLIASCLQLLTDTVYLEQQDRGKLLGDRRMKWHDASSWDRNAVPGDDSKWVAGKAYSFFHRPDHKIVGISKMGWTTTSDDNGITWTQPVVPDSLITGKAKVWAQQTSDGKSALVYNPSTRTRYPLIVVTSDDGITFRDMRIVQGELPVQRYSGKFRSIGPQYVRGISHWADDHSRNDKALWLTYSMSKEDIWVSRVPLPVKADATTFDEPKNIYQPKWSSVTETDGILTLASRDPYDYASATKVFSETQAATISMQLRVNSITRPIDIDVHSKFGGKLIARIQLLETGDITCSDATGTRLLHRFRLGEWVGLNLDLKSDSEAIQRIIFRTGAYRNVGGQNPVEPGTDRPIDPTSIDVRDLQIS